MDQRRHGRLRNPPGGRRPAARHQDHAGVEGRGQGVRRRADHRADHQALFQLRPVPHRAERREGEHRPGPLDAQQERDQAGGIRRVLPVHRPRPREADAAPPLQRRRAHRHPVAALRAAAEHGDDGHGPDRVGGEPLLPQGADPGQGQGALPRVAPLPQGRRGQRGPAAEHLARDDAGHVAAAEAEQGPHKPLPEIPRRDLGEGSRDLREVLRGVSAFSKGGHRHRLHPQGRPWQARALRVVAARRRQNHLAG